MDTRQLRDKLKELGISTNNNNNYPKSTFISNDVVVVALYPREMEQDFYFSNQRDNTIYKVPYVENPENFDKDDRTGKFLIPLSSCVKVWEDKPYEELPDINFREMTLRHYACIHLGVPDTGIVWLDEIIRKSK